MKYLSAILLLLLPVCIYGQGQQVSLLFVGDLMQHQAQIDAAHRADGTYDYSHCFSLVKDDIGRADIAIGNLEVTLGGKPYRGYPQFSAPDEYLEALKDAGFDILATANNHSLDRHKRGLERTLTLADSLGIPTVGTYRDATDRAARYPLIVEKNGVRIALLCATYGTNGIATTPPNIVNSLDRNELAADIQDARSMKADVIIAIVHWGNEYHRHPDTGQRDLARWLIDQGVDHIIGSHPHVVQPVEWVEAENGNKSLCYYSLGNYVSTQKQALCMLEAMAWVTIHVDENGPSIDVKKTGVLPLVCHYNAMPVRMESVYLLEDYTEEQAASHGIKAYGGVDLRLSDLQKWTTEVFEGQVLTADQVLGTNQ